MADNVNDAEVEAAASSINNSIWDISNYYQNLRNQKAAKRQEVLEMINDIVELKACLIEATQNSNVGTYECCSALDSVIGKLNQVAANLENL